MRRAILIAIAALAAAGIWAVAAHAAVRLVFSQPAAEPEDSVSLRTVGGTLPQPRRGPARVFLVREADVDSVRSVRDRRLTLLGRTTVDRRGVGRLRFRTPNLPPGNYESVLHCPSCNGRRLFRRVSEPFRITPALRDCESSVYGDLGPDWRQNAVQAGPVWFVGLRGYGPEDFAENPARRGWYPPLKVLLVVENGVTVTLSVPRDAWGTYGLVYDQALFNRRWMPIRHARYAMTFEGCPRGELPHTQFNGALVSAGPRCAPLDISIAGGETRRYQIPFGRPC